MKPIKQALAALTCAMAATAASAATVKITFDNPIFTGSGYDAVYISFTENGVQKKPYVGAGRFQGTASDLVDIKPEVFYDGVDNVFMYCYDVYQGISSGQKDVLYEVSFSSADVNSRTLDFLGAVNYVLSGGSNNNGPVNPYAWLAGPNPQGSVNASVTGAFAAIQLGIWESKYETDGSWDLGTGAFSALALDSNTGSWWNTFKNAIGTSDALDSQYVMVLKNASYQDMIAGDPPSDVPEPGSLALMGAALAGLAAARRGRTAGRVVAE